MRYGRGGRTTSIDAGRLRGGCKQGGTAYARKRGSRPSRGSTVHEEGEEVCCVPSVRARAHEVAPWFAPQKDFLRILKFPVDNVT